MLLLAAGFQIRLENFRQNEYQRISKMTNEVEEARYFTQILDHFNNSNAETFQQKYYINLTYYRPNVSDVAILQIGGEAPISAADVGPAWTADYFAKNLSAINVELEHRFYGDSVPQPLNYSYLSSRQALADVARFADYLKREYGVSKVVSYGGSYPGNMAAWARVKFPFVVDAAISSSGPLMGKTHFHEYFEKDQFVLDDVKPGMWNVTMDVFAEFDELLRTDQARAAEYLRNETIKTAQLSDLDRANIFSTLSAFASMIQYAAEDHSDIQAYCDRVHDLDSFFEWLFDFYGENDLGPLLYEDYVALERTGANAAWTWQVCTEFGYLQDLGDYIPLEYYYATCLDVFREYYDAVGITTTAQIADYMDQVVDHETNFVYGARNQPRTHIYFANGFYDPWSVLGMQEAGTWAEGQIASPDSVIRVIPGASHCSDLRMSWDSNAEVREDQLARLRKWLNIDA